MSDKLKALGLAVLKPFKTKKAIVGIVVAIVALVGIELSPEVSEQIADVLSKFLESTPEAPVAPIEGA